MLSIAFSCFSCNFPYSRCDNAVFLLLCLYSLIARVDHPWLPGRVKRREVVEDVALVNGEAAADLLSKTRIRS